MNTIYCAYCTEIAIGLDEEDSPTCGSDSCTTSMYSLPNITECSNNEEDEV